MIGYRMVVNVLVVYPHDCTADWELWLTASITRVSFYSISLVQEKIKIQSTVSTECISHSHPCKVKEL